MNQYEKHQMKKTAQLAGLAVVVTGLTAWGIWDSMQPKEYDRFLQPTQTNLVSRVTKTNSPATRTNEPPTSMSTDTNSEIYKSCTEDRPFALNDDYTPGTVDKTNSVKTNAPTKPKTYTPTANTNTSTKVPKIKNNNPGNIRAVRKIKWKGQIGSNRGFCVFDSLEHGYKAMEKNLTTYDQKYGRDTIKEIIESWAPRCENNTHGYISEVSIQTGYAPNQELDLKDKKIATNLMVAMTRQEHGKHVPASYISKAIGSHYR